MFSPERMTGLLYMYDFMFDGHDASSLALFLCIKGFTLISVALRGVERPQLSPPCSWKYALGSGLD